jgi:hypothetical protein
MASKPTMTMATTDWTVLSPGDATRVHHAAFQAVRHRTGHHMVLLWFGIMRDAKKPRWVWRLLYPMGGVYPDYEGCPTTVPYGWANGLLAGVKPKVTQP